MSDTTTTDTTTGNEAGQGEGQQTEQEKTYTQAELDQIIRSRLAQQAKTKFGDYDDLKTKAEGAKTIEQKLAELEQKNAAAEARALRSDIAARHGISAEDRDLFLTGTDEDALTAQAKRLVEREADRKKQGNVAPREGTANNSGKADPMREFARNLFGNAD